MRRTKSIPREHLRVGRTKSGLGLFATARIFPGEYIEYVGDIIPTPQADKMTGARYLFELSGRWTINGSARSNLARYINHSCVPNCESVQEGKRIFIKALKEIPSGEELVYDYGSEYFDEFIGSEHCVCPKCEKKRSQRTTSDQKGLKAD